MNEKITIEVFGAFCTHGMLIVRTPVVIYGKGKTLCYQTMDSLPVALMGSDFKRETVLSILN